LKTQHSVTISGLARKATYYVQILSRDTNGNLGTSRGSFQTK
jgi:chitodextrinase